MCYDRRFFRIDQLREAVEYLNLQPQTGFTGLVAETTVRAERFQLYAQPMLQLAAILGKTPREVWSRFDCDVDRQVHDLTARFLPGYGN